MILNRLFLKKIILFDCEQRQKNMRTTEFRLCIEHAPRVTDDDDALLRRRAQRTRNAAERYNFLRSTRKANSESETYFVESIC